MVDIALKNQLPIYSATIFPYNFIKFENRHSEPGCTSPNSIYTPSTTLSAHTLTFTDLTESSFSDKSSLLSSDSTLPSGNTSPAFTNKTIPQMNGFQQYEGFPKLCEKGGGELSRGAAVGCIHGAGRPRCAVDQYLPFDCTHIELGRTDHYIDSESSIHGRQSYDWTSTGDTTPSAINKPVTKDIKTTQHQVIPFVSMKPNEPHKAGSQCNLSLNTLDKNKYFHSTNKYSYEKNQDIQFEWLSPPSLLTPPNEIRYQKPNRRQDHQYGNSRNTGSFDTLQVLKESVREYNKEIGVSTTLKQNMLPIHPLTDRCIDVDNKRLSTIHCSNLSDLGYFGNDVKGKDKQTLYLKTKENNIKYHINKTQHVSINDPNEFDKLTTLPIKTGKRVQYRKTKVCPWNGHGRCLMGDNCNYAHSKAELRGRPDLTRTRLCPDGMSCFSEECRFAHDFAQLRATGAFFRTKLCKFWMRGNCPSGVHCRHAHGEEQLRQPDSNCNNDTQALDSLHINKKLMGKKSPVVASNVIQPSGTQITTSLPAYPCRLDGKQRTPFNLEQPVCHQRDSHNPFGTIEPNRYSYSEYDIVNPQHHIDWDKYSDKTSNHTLSSPKLSTTGSLPSNSIASSTVSNDDLTAAFTNFLMYNKLSSLGTLLADEELSDVSVPFNKTDSIIQHNAMHTTENPINTVEELFHSECSLTLPSLDSDRELLNKQVDLQQNNLSWPTQNPITSFTQLRDSVNSSLGILDSSLNKNTTDIETSFLATECLEEKHSSSNTLSCDDFKLNDIVRLAVASQDPDLLECSAKILRASLQLKRQQDQRAIENCLVQGMLDNNGFMCGNKNIQNILPLHTGSIVHPESGLETIKTNYGSNNQPCSYWGEV